MVREQTGNARKRRGTSAVVFAACQVIWLTALATGALWHVRTVKDRPELPALRNQPRVIRTLYDDPAVISDEQLALVLQQLEPRLRHPRPKINHVDHMLRFWGVESRFDDPRCLSGHEMRDILLNHHCYAEYWPPPMPPLLTQDALGVAVRTQEGLATSSHMDHTLASVGEVGTPLDYPVITPEGQSNLRAVMERALRDFRLNRREYEWTMLALILYAEDGRPWYSKENQRIDFEILAHRAMRQPLNQGICYGNHRLYSLAALLQVDRNESMLHPEIRNDIIEHLKKATRCLVANQSAEGWWDRNWPDASQSADEPDEEDHHSGSVSPLGRKLLATGHALEWWAIAPAEVQPPREVVVRAAQWMAQQVSMLDDETIVKNYTFLSHVGRALALWRGEFPALIYDRLPREQGAST